MMTIDVDSAISVFHIVLLANTTPKNNSDLNNEFLYHKIKNH